MMTLAATTVVQSIRRDEDLVHFCNNYEVSLHRRKLVELVLRTSFLHSILIKQPSGNAGSLEIHDG